MLNLEEAAQQLITIATESKKLTFDALKLAKDRKFNLARNKLEDARVHSLKAHEIQTELICAEADGHKVKINLLMVHAQDHLMTTLLARDLVEELICFYEDVLDKN